MNEYRAVPNAPEFKEGELRPTTEVVLHFLRHEEKERRQSGQSDYQVELTTRGREKAIQKGREEPARPAVSWAAGSPRVRSAHTALLRLAAGESAVTPAMNFTEARAEVEKGLKYGHKVTTLPELNFLAETDPEFENRENEAFTQGRGLEFVVKESDDLVRQLRDREVFSHSRMAANYASLIAREMRVGNNFNRIAARDPEKYQKYDNRLERYFGSHQGVLECFYAKVVEKLHGTQKVEEFIASFQDTQGKINGFDFQEGYQVRIINNSGGQRVILEGVHGLPDMELTPDLLREIIADAIKLDEEIEK